MAQTLKDIMTTNPATCPGTATITEVAKLMRDRDIGDVIVLDGDRITGIATDRDIVIRAVAEGNDGTTTIAQVCSGDVVTLSPGDDVSKAVQVMRDKAVRRLPVVEGGRPVGIVSLGDLAIDRDNASALADISAAPGNK
jgi:CBS domain-containing protein